MIALTRLNGSPLYVNADLIKWAESAPDTMLTLVSGEKVVVRESCSQVVELIFAQRVRMLEAVARMLPATEALLSAAAALSLVHPHAIAPPEDAKAGEDETETG